MAVRELFPSDIEAEWPRLQTLLGGDPARRERIEKMLSGENAYALVVEGGKGVPGGLAVVEHYQSAWIFDDQIAAIREIAGANGARAELLDAIEERARAADMDQLSRFLPGDDETLPWWYQNGFREYMSAFRRALPDEADETEVASDDGITIRVVTDLDADWPKVWPLLEQLDRHHAGLTGSPLHDGRKESARRSLPQDPGEALVMLAEVDGRAVATSTAELGERQAGGSRTGYRTRLFVEPFFRGRHLPARFEALALRWFRERGVTHVERWIVAGNERPRQIWAARGYRPERFLLRKALRR